MGTTRRWERRISFVVRVISFCFCWLVFFVLTYLLFCVLEFVYMATLADDVKQDRINK
jgi:hypothetical protein